MQIEVIFICNNLCSYFICLFVLFYYIAERTYLKGVIGLSTSTAKKQVISAEGLQKSTVQSSHLKAYVKKNLKRYSVHHNFS